MTERRVEQGRRGPVAVLAVTMALALVAVGCGSSGTSGGDNAAPTTTAAPKINAVGGMTAGPPDAPAASGGKIVYGIDAEPEGLDPVRYAFSQAGHAVASAVYEPLATLDDNGQVVPYLATAFDHSPDNKTWTITLPTGVTYHDGTPFNADAAVTVLNAYKTSVIDGPALTDIDSFTATDPTHVVAKLNKPLAALPALFTTQAGYMIAPSMLTNTDSTNPIGTGPFVFEKHTDGQIWSFKKNPTYRQKGLPHLDNIDFVPVPDPASRTDQLRNNGLDVIQTQDGKQILDLRNSVYKRAENIYGDKGFLILNTSKPPFDNLSARKAVAYATDAAKWRKDVFAGVAGPANSPYGPGQPGYTEKNDFPTFDMEEAKQAVAQYKQETGKDLTFTFLAVDDPTNMSVANVFADGYKQAGMTVTVDAKPQINLLAAVAAGLYESSQFRVFAQPNPDADVHFYRSSTIAPVSLNFPRYANPDVDAAIDEATASTDQNVRNTAYLKINKIFAEQLPFIWLGQEVWMVAANPRVNGIYGAANGSIATVGPKTWIAGLSVST